MRCAGRTKRMLLRAILNFLDGNDVIVACFSEKYARDLRHQTATIIASLNLAEGFSIKPNDIRYLHMNIRFVSFDTLWKMERGQKKLFNVFEDHHYPIPHHPV